MQTISVKRLIEPKITFKAVQMSMPVGRVIVYTGDLMRGTLARIENSRELDVKD